MRYDREVERREGGGGREREGGRAHLMYSNRALSTAVKNSLTPIPASADTPTVCKEHTQHAWRSVVAYTACFTAQTLEAEAIVSCLH